VVANGGGAASFVGIRLIKGSDFVQETQLFDLLRLLMAIAI